MAQFANGHAAERKPMLSPECLEPFNRVPAVDDIMHFDLRRFKRLENDILSVLKGSLFSRRLMRASTSGLVM